jgi:multiple sugar transport system ATP-binding protein
VTDRPPHLRDVAMSFQHGALYPHMSVFDNIGFPLKVAGVEHHEIDRRVRAIARLLHVDHTLDRRPARLSGGERQRVAMGRALVRQPEVYLMDEPLSHLDTKLRIEMRSVIVALQRELGVTSVYVTHDQAEAMAMGDRVAVMRAGRVVQCGSPLDVFEHPVDLFVATFVGSPPMTVLCATVAMRDGLLGLRIGSQFLTWPGLRDEYPWLTEHDSLAVGIRPDALRVGVGRDQPGSTIEVSAGVVEDLGHECVVHTTLSADQVRADDGGTVVIRDSLATLAVTMPGRPTVDPYRPVCLAVATDRLHLFDLTTAARL